MNTKTINDLKALTIDQYESAREKAIERVRARIGDRPQRDDFKRELGSLWTILDVIALVVFVAALVVSSVHIVVHMGALTAASAPAGAEAAYTLIHQIAFIFLAEGSMILFLVMFGMTRNNWRKWVYLLLATASVVFVIIANVHSSIGLLESLLAPAFTIGVGLKLEHLIVQSLARRDEVNRRYLEAISVYEAASADPKAHPDYPALLKQQVWAALAALPSNRDFRDAPAGFKAAAVAREIARDLWAHEPVPEVTVMEVPLEPIRPPRISGNLAHEMADLVGINQTQTDSAPIVNVSANGKGKRSE